jgi:hypothetical protein
MMELAVQIVRFVNDEPQPGIVACEFVDAEGRCHTLIDKVSGFSASLLDASSIGHGLTPWGLRLLCSKNLCGTRTSAPR